MNRRPKDFGRTRRSRITADPWSVAALCLIALAWIGAPAAGAVIVNDAADALHNPGCATTGLGDCTLRDAITFANSGSGTTAINFNIPGCAGVCTIVISGALPTISQSVVIDGYSQPGSSPNTLAVGEDAVLLIEISGGGGLFFNGPGSSTVQGLVLGGGTTGIEFFGGSGNTVTGNFIGTTPTGLAAHGIGGQGVAVFTSSNHIGGATPAARNVISACSGGGVAINGASASGNVILGNYIGTDASGTSTLANSGGISTQGTNTTIGGAATGAGNLISGTTVGVASSGPGTVIQGNLIGTDATGNLALANGTGVNISGPMATGNHVGGTAAGEGNVISGNTLYAMALVASGATVEGNFIGTNPSGVPLQNSRFGGFTAILVSGSNNVIGGTAAGAGNVIAHNYGNGVTVTGSTSIGNTIRGNSIFENGGSPGAPGLGIHLGSGTMAIPNDACDTDAGPNNQQNFPIITSASVTGGNVMVAGTLNSTASTLFQIDLYLTGCDSSGYGEGENYLGATTATTDPACNGNFSTTVPVSGSGSIVTATATDPAGNTSEFSAGSPVGQGLALHYYTLAPCRIIDTRNPSGPLGGPPLFGGQTDRVFSLLGHCGIPADALSVSLNVTVTGSTAAGDLRIYPAGLTLPLVSVINYRQGQTRANNAVAALSCLGALAVHCDQPAGTQVQLIIDVVGYFR
jgi:hypothetical protein